MAVADFNGDGKHDLATANSFSDNVSVLLGNGDGTFQAAANFAAGNGPWSVAVGDFNGDGKPDLAVANSSATPSACCWATATAPSRTRVNYAAGNLPRSVAVGDFNGDGKPDLATANDFSDNVSVLLNNAAPTDIALSTNSLAENQPVDTVVGSLSSTDPNNGDTFSYSLVSGDGDTDNASFAIDASGNLRTAAGFDFEAQSSYSIRVRSTDTGGLSVEKVLTISVSNINETPTDIALSNGSVAENQPVDTVVGTFSTTDPDTSDTFSYSLVSGDGDTDNASFTIDASGNLRTAASLDYEAKSSYSIRVRSTDTTGLFVENMLTISVSNVNETPTDIALSNGSVAENQPVGTVVGSLSTTDPDNGDSFAYSLVNGTGDTDNASFTIDASGNLRTAANLDFEAQSSYTIRVRSTDAGGLTVEKLFTIAGTNVNDVTPTISVPGAQTAFEDVAKRITGIRVADADGGNLTVTLVVNHGRLTLGTTAGLTVSGNGTRLVSLSGSIDNLNAALDELKYRGHLNYSGADRLTITATDGDLDATGRVGITVKSAAQQAAALRASVTALRTTSVLGARSALLSYAWLTPSGTPWDIVNTRNFLRTVNMYRQVGILTQAQANSLLVPGNILLLSVRRR